MAGKFKIRKGDQVTVITGREKGKTGEVIAVQRDNDRVLVQGVNMVKKHVRASQAGPGGIEQKEAPLHISNVAHVDPDGGKATRIGFDTDKKGNKTRVARRSGKAIG
jgi:large subunit ribosomal protein L24